MKFDSNKENLIKNAYWHYCNHSQTEPCCCDFTNVEDILLFGLEDEIANAEFLAKLGYLDMVKFENNKLYYRLTQKGFEYIEPPEKPLVTTINQGIGSSVVIGNNNSIQFSPNIRQEIADADLTPEQREILIKFFDSLQKATDSQSRKQSISDFANSVASNATGASIANLLSFVLQKVLPF